MSKIIGNKLIFIGQKFKCNKESYGIIINTPSIKFIYLAYLCDVNLSGFKIKSSLILNSKLANCNLSRCTIYNLEGSNINAYRTFFDDSRLYDCSFLLCYITSLYIEKSIIDRCIINSSNVETCKIDQSDLLSSRAKYSICSYSNFTQSVSLLGNETECSFT